MTAKLQDDCFAHGERRLQHEQALGLLKERVRPVASTESLPLAEVTGRILAEAIVAPHAVPAHTNAAVDGYSFAAEAYDPAAGAKLPVAGRAAAGHRHDGPPARSTAVRIFTGAVMPDGHDTVLMQEDARSEIIDGRTFVSIPPGLKRGANVRRAGEDVTANETVLTAGAVLRPQDIAQLASLGIGQVACFKRLRVAILSSGDEVVRPGASISAGQVYDANAPMLGSLIAGAGGQVTDLGVLPDQLEEVKARLVHAASTHDAIITSGGTSRGEEDHVVAALDAIGKRHLWQLAIKPGRPMSFGQVGDCVMVGLPGNPVAVFVCFLLYVWPLLRRMGGAAWPEPRRYHLPALFSFPNRKAGRREFWRGMLKETAAGLAVDKFPRDGSGLISGLRAADGLIEIAEDVPEVKPGDLVAFIPFTNYAILGH